MRHPPVLVKICFCLYFIHVTCLWWQEQKESKQHPTELNMVSAVCNKIKLMA